MTKKNKKKRRLITPTISEEFYQRLHDPVTGLGETDQIGDVVVALLEDFISELEQLPSLTERHRRIGEVVFKKKRNAK